MQQVGNEVVCKEMADHILRIVSEKGLRYETNDFPSGASMIDVWIGNALLVIQLTDQGIGLSVIKDDPAAFDSRPDLFFKDMESFCETFIPLLEKTGK